MPMGTVTESQAMQEAEGNPTGNKLGSAVTETDLQHAIETSGYPFQALAVDAIVEVLADAGRDCITQEEWPFIDDEHGSQQIRTLDGLIDCEITSHVDSGAPGLPAEPQGYLRHHLVVLLECKQSELPFVFFLRDVPFGEIPVLAGVPHESIEIEDSDGEVYAGMSTSDALALDEIPFRTQAATAVAMSRIQRRGNRLELSGEDAYRSLTLPIMKSVGHYVRKERPDDQRMYFDVASVFPVAVLQAPMVGVRMETGSAVASLVPWVRLIRLDPMGHAFLPGGSAATALDVVHADFVKHYSEAALATAQEIAARVDAFAVPFILGRARFGQERGSEEEQEKPDPRSGRSLGLDPTLNQTDFDAAMRRKFIEVHHGKHPHESERGGPDDPD